MRVILRSVSRSSSGAQTIVLWIICRATRRAATAVLRQALSTRSDSIMPSRLLGRDGALAGEGGMGGVLRIEIVVLAALATIVPVRRRDLQDLDAGLLQVAKQPRAVGAGRLDADALELPEGAHPGEHLLVAVPGRREALAAESRSCSSTTAATWRSLCVSTPPTTRRRWCFVRGHVASPELPDDGCCERLRQDRVPGQDSNATERQALLGSHASARRNLAARRSRAADRSGERHGSWSIGVRVRPRPRRLAAPATLTGRSL